MESEQAQSEAALAQRRVDLAERSLERVRHLAKDGFVAEAQVQTKQEELLDLQARAQSAQRNALSLQRELRAVHAERASTATQLQTDLAQADRALASLTQDRTENDARRTQIIVAPQSGVVTALHLSEGAPVQSGQSVATLVPQTRADETAVLEAELYAASRTAGFVRAGQEVYLRYAAYPYQKFGLARGTVTRVSRTPVAPQDLPAGQQQALMSATQSNEPLYRIKVALDHQVIQAYGQAQALKPGMTLEADIVQDRRALWEWMFEPLLALKHRA
jgi:membrane fusion protein